MKFNYSSLPASYHEYLWSHEWVPMGRAPYKFQRGSGLSLITMNILLKIVQPAHVDLNKVKAESYVWKT